MPETKQDNPIWIKADAAFQQATLKIIERAKQTNTPIVVWEDGKVREIPAEEFEAALRAQRSSRQFGLGKGKLTINQEDDEHLEGFEGI